MRVLCVLLFCLSTAAALRFKYQRGKRYSYKYEGLIAQGVAEALEKDLALKIRAKAHFDYLNGGGVMMTLENIKLHKIVDKVLYNDRVDTNVGEEEPLEDVRKKLEDCLKNPVKFSFKRLVERMIITEKDSREWCVNIQRAIINHFYLPIKDNAYTYQPRFPEVTIMGKCKTAYYILWNKEACQVKRVIDLTKCTLRPTVFALSQPNTDAFYLKRVGRATAKELPNFVRTAAYMHYDLDCDKKGGFLIRRVVSENIQDFTINGDLYKAGKAVAAHTKQTLTLIAKHQPIPQPPPTIKKKSIRSGLLFVFDKDKTDIQSPGAQEKFLEKAKSEITALKDHLKSGNIKTKTAMRVTRLVSVLRHCTALTLKKLVKDVLAETNIDLKRLVLDALARVGTEPAGAVLKVIINARNFPNELERITFGVGWVRGLDYRFMKHVMAICEHEAVVADAKACEACWLSFGTLLNRLMIAWRKNPRMTQDIRFRAFKTNAVRTIKEAMTNARSYEEKIVYLKAIGNAGWIDKNIFYIVYKLIRNVLTPLHVKVQAIWSLRHMARVQPYVVRRTCMPLMANPLADPEIRASCYKILIQNDPSLLTCTMIAAILAREAVGKGPRSNQFVAFVASDLRTSVNYDNIDTVKASRARLLLRIIPRAIAFSALFYSKGINVPIDAGSGMGLELRLNKINGPRTFIPRHLHTKFKVNMPGISANFFEFGLRMQGIHDTFLPYIGPKCKEKKTPLDILSYILGTNGKEQHVDHARKVLQNNLPPRFMSYVKLYGSEVYFGRLLEADLLAIVRDALFGDKKTKKGGCTFAANDINCELPFIRAHLLSEKRYMVPTLIGIPFKYSGKVAAVAKGEMAAHVTGQPKVLTSKFDELRATVRVKPTVSFHMHHKVSAWLPIFESGIIIRHELFSQPKVDFVLTVNQEGFRMEEPIVEADQKLLILKPQLRGVMRKEINAGDRNWFDIDLQLTQRGFIDVPETCYGKTYLNLMLCKQGHIVDAEYLRLKRLTTFPFYWLNQWDIRLKNDKTNVPTKFEASYEITTNNDAQYKGEGKLAIIGKTEETTATMDVTCDKTTYVCETNWKFKHKKCPATCTARTTINYAREDKLAIFTKYGPNQNKELNHEVLVKDQGKTLNIINTWNPVVREPLPFAYKLQQVCCRLVALQLSSRYLDAGATSQAPEFLSFLDLNGPAMITFFHRFFGIKETTGNQIANRCEVEVKLINKFLADIFVKTKTMKFRRINQELPVAVNNFYLEKRKAMMDRFYARCLVKGTNYIETTDQVVIQEQIPGTCPFVLAEDARGDEAKWRILLRQAQGGRQNLIVMIGEVKIELKEDKTVKVNGAKIVITTGKKTVTGGTIQLVGDELILKSDCGFEIRFDGGNTRVFFSPWYHNRLRGICGNNDAEQWTDFATRRRTCMPETMTKEFLREWVVPGATCKDKYCKMKAKHIELPAKINGRGDKVCFTIGRFLRCINGCKCKQTQTLKKVPYHCLGSKDPLVEKLRSGDTDVALERKSVDVYDKVVEHLACNCNCQ